MLNELLNLAKGLSALETESADLDTREKAAREKLETAAEAGGIDQPKVQRMIGDARLILDLCAGRRRVLARLIPTARQKTLESLRSTEHQFNGLLTQHLKEAVAATTTRLLVAHNGDAETLKNTTRFSQLPIAKQIERARCFNHSILAQEDSRRGNPPGGKTSEIAWQFIDHAKTVARQIGLTLPTAAK